MIVREYEDKYELIRQHDHALLSGEMAFHSGHSPFRPSAYYDILTASFHDMSWIPADEQFVELYNFNDYPLSKRLPLYKKGIDRLEKMNLYVALLTSLHYTAFFKLGTDERLDAFLKWERERQSRLKPLFPHHDIHLDLQHLKMWDNLSLYVCLNKPGTAKENEHPWFKKGIKSVTASGDEITIQGQWQNEHTVTFSPSPFKNSWSTYLPIYTCQKPFAENNIAQEPVYQKIVFAKG